MGNVSFEVFDVQCFLIQLISGYTTRNDDVINLVLTTNIRDDSVNICKELEGDRRRFFHLLNCSNTSLAIRKYPLAWPERSVL